jgi:uncharacterized protein (UPF0216 family)
MTKRRKISKIAEEMFEMINQKPTAKEIEELAEILNEENPDIEDEDTSIDKIASSQVIKGTVDGHESDRI